MKIKIFIQIRFCHYLVKLSGAHVDAAGEVVIDGAAGIQGALDVEIESGLKMLGEHCCNNIEHELATKLWRLI